MNSIQNLSVALLSLFVGLAILHGCGVINLNDSRRMQLATWAMAAIVWGAVFMRATGYLKPVIYLLGAAK
jgi:hypothetical protein